MGSVNFVEINTNTYTTSGSLEIKGASTANSSFSFLLDTVVSSGEPNKAFRVSGNAGPYAFAEGDSLVVVIDDDIVNSTFSILFNSAGTTTSGSSGTVFADTALSSLFTTADEINDYFVAFTAGANTTSETIVTVADQGGDVARYTFGSVPANFADYAVGDLANISGLTASENNLNAVITGKGADWIEVTNADAVNATLQTGTGVLSQKRTITDYNQLTGEITVGVAFTDTPTIGDTFIVIPTTVNNVVDFMNNTKITSISLKATVEGVTNNTKIQIASNSSGSDGAIQITGGSANEKLVFNIELFIGLAGYSYWIGLIDLVHKTIYGDDADLISFPGVGAAGIIFRVLAPTTKDIIVELDVTLREGVTIASLENEIRSAVTGYVNNLGVSDDVIIEEIRAAVIKIAGVTDVSISDPVVNVAIADNELARVADSDILIG